MILKSKILHLYNPFRRASLETLNVIYSDSNEKIICCGDFNAPSTLWGTHNDEIGQVIEEFMVN